MGILGWVAMRQGCGGDEVGMQEGSGVDPVAVVRDGGIGKRVL